MLSVNESAPLPPAGITECDIFNAMLGCALMVPLVESWLRFKAGSEVFRARMGWVQVTAPRRLRRGQAA
jgi:hypothetical protein